MYPLPQDHDLSFLHGALLLQVATGACEVILNFHADISITALTDFAVRTPAGVERFEDPRQGSPALFECLGVHIAHAQPTASGGLELAFDNGIVIELFDTSECYESFLVQNGPDLLVV